MKSFWSQEWTSPNDGISDTTVFSRVEVQVVIVEEEKSHPLAIELLFDRGYEGQAELQLTSRK